MTQDSPVIPDLEYSSEELGRWRANHGNLLLGFVAVIFLVGASVLFYKQNLSFAPPRFPDAENIDAVLDDAVGVSGTAFIRILGAANDKGTMKIAIYGAESTFERPADAVFASVEPITAGQVYVPVPLTVLPEKIAIAVFHDENDDSALNKNAIGFPSERYGFSRNARGLTGPPTWAQTVIPRPSDDTTIEIFVR
ncbi:MAG TPA: hypothetical protein DEF45_11650 [Rhodopirellula sp.]|nr:hypothetical protein [Rhodopirellula sp.]